MGCGGVRCGFFFFVERVAGGGSGPLLTVSEPRSLLCEAIWSRERRVATDANWIWHLGFRGSDTWCRLLRLVMVCLVRERGRSALFGRG